MLALSVASIACSQNDEASPKQSKTSLDITAGLSFNTTHFPSNSNYQKLNSYNNFSFGLYIEKEITKRWTYGYNIYAVSHQRKIRFPSYFIDHYVHVDTIIRSKVGTAAFIAPQILLRLNNPDSKFNIQTGLMTGTGFMFMKGFNDPNITVSLPLLGVVGFPIRASYSITQRLHIVANIIPQYVFTIHDFSKIRNTFLTNYENFSVPYRLGISFNL